MTWVKKGIEVVQFSMIFIVGIGFALWFVSIFLTAVGETSVAGLAINGLVNDLTGALTTMGEPLFMIALMLIIYVLGVSAGLLPKFNIGKKYSE